MKVELDDSAEKATMSYEFAFSENFDWTLGGKLPGLCSDGMCMLCLHQAISDLDCRR